MNLKLYVPDSGFLSLVGAVVHPPKLGRLNRVVPVAVFGMDFVGIFGEPSDLTFNLGDFCAPCLVVVLWYHVTYPW